MTQTNRTASPRDQEKTQADGEHKDLPAQVLTGHDAKIRLRAQKDPEIIPRAPASEPTPEEDTDHTVREGNHDRSPHSIQDFPRPTPATTPFRKSHRRHMVSLSPDSNTRMTHAMAMAQERGSGSFEPSDPEFSAAAAAAVEAIGVLYASHRSLIARGGFGWLDVEEACLTLAKASEDSFSPAQGIAEASRLAAVAHQFCCSQMEPDRGVEPLGRGSVSSTRRSPADHHQPGSSRNATRDNLKFKPRYGPEPESTQPSKSRWADYSEDVYWNPHLYLFHSRDRKSVV